PLAIELAAARVRLVGLDGLLARLDEPLRLLASRRGTSGRLPSLEQALARSWDALAPDDRLLLTACTTLPGPFVVAAIETAVGDVVSFDVVDGLDSLMDHALLRQAPDGRIGPTFAVREFVQAHAGPEEEAVARQTLAGLRRWYAAPGPRVPATEYPAPSAVRMLAAELDGALRALKGALDAGEIDVARQIAGWTVPLLMLQSSPRRAFDVASLLRSAAPEDPVALVLGALAGAGSKLPQDEQVAHDLGVLERSGRSDLRSRYVGLTLRTAVERAGKDRVLPLLELAERLLESTTEPLLRARLLASLGWCDYRAGRRHQAWERLQEALALYRTQDRAFAASQVCISLGGMAQAETRFEESEAFLAMSMAPFERAGVKEWNLGAGDTLGLIRLVQGRYEEADRENRRVYDRSRALGNLERQSGMASRLGTTASYRGDQAAAASWFELCRTTAAQLGLRAQECAANYNLGTLALSQDRLEEARTHLERARDGYRALGRHPHQAYTRVRLAEIALERGDHSAGLEEIGLAIGTLREADRRVWLGEARAIEARLQAEGGDQGALLISEHAVDLLREGGHDAGLVGGLCHRGHVALRLGHRREAEASLAESRALVAELGLGASSRAVGLVERLDEALRAS
ncbi:MAG: tetratricopeptide repeat protein, partial [Deltaproteobacteria bacterium]|nr:tetratricopeptide repeat protein [Deltaproteobacteria bacterium]